MPATGPFRIPGPANTFVASWEATGLLINFVRDPSEFALNRYVRYRPAKLTSGIYLQLDPAAGIRIIGGQDGLFRWPDGADRPSGLNNVQGFRYAPYRTNRFDYPATLGNLTLGQSPWDLMATQSQALMEQGMTNRTRRVLNYLQNPANWGTNTADANVLNNGAGYWNLASNDPANAAYQAIRKTIFSVQNRIRHSSLSKVRAKDLVMVMSPNLGALAASSPEFVDYLRSSPEAMAQVRGDAPGNNGEFGLPDKLHGVTLVIEDAQMVTSLPDAPVVQQWLKDDMSIIFLCVKADREGTTPVPVGDESAPADVSTCQIFHYTGPVGPEGAKRALMTDGAEGQGGLLTVGSIYDPRSERTEIHVVENIAELMATELSGFLVTNVVAANGS